MRPTTTFHHNMLVATKTRISNNADALTMLGLALAEEAGVEPYSKAAQKVCDANDGFQCLMRLQKRLNDELPALHRAADAEAKGEVA